MVRKVVVRTFKVCCVLFAVLLTGIAACVILAWQTPSFYAAQRDIKADDAVTAETQQIADEFEEWAMKSMAAAHRRKTSGNGRQQPVAGDAGVPETHMVTLTEEQINQTLASGEHGAGSVKNPRVRILDDRIRIGMEVGTDSPWIFTADLHPDLNGNGELQLAIVNSWLGELPFPLQTLLELAEKRGGMNGGRFRVDLTGEAPMLIIDISPNRRNRVTVHSVQCTEGTIRIEFRQPDDRDDAEQQQLTSLTD